MIIDFYNHLLINGTTQVLYRRGPNLHLDFRPVVSQNVALNQCYVPPLCQVVVWQHYPVFFLSFWQFCCTKPNWSKIFKTRLKLLLKSMALFFYEWSNISFCFPVLYKCLCENLWGVCVSAERPEEGKWAEILLRMYLCRHVCFTFLDNGWLWGSQPS